MKRSNLMFIGVLLILMSFLSSCNDENGDATISLGPEQFYVHMFVTNNAGEDLVLKSDSYIKTGDYAESFRFDSWNVYLDGKAIQSGKDNYSYRFKSINRFQGDRVKQKNISLDTDGSMQQMMKDWYKEHVVEYKVKSTSLFGDEEEHVIRMEFLATEPEPYEPFVVNYAITVDGVEQEVFYPEEWNVYPQSQYDNYIRYPYFTLNVDR